MNCGEKIHISNNIEYATNANARLELVDPFFYFGVGAIYTFFIGITAYFIGNMQIRAGYILSNIRIFRGSASCGYRQLPHLFTVDACRCKCDTFE